MKLTRWLTCLAVLVLGAKVARADSASFTGTLSSPETPFEVILSLPSTATIGLQTYGFGGGTNAAGTVILPGGTDPFLAIFAGTGPGATILTDGTPPPFNCNFGGAPDFSSLECQIVPLYTVPAGKTAVIESVSAYCQTPPGTATAEFKLIYVGPDGSEDQLRIPPSSAVPFGPSVLSEAALNLKTYVSAGSPINFLGQANNASTPMPCAVNVSGHLE